MLQRAKRLHRWNAIALLLFVALHLATHSTAWGGIDRHFAALDFARPLYRSPLLEPVLLILLVAQIVLGARFAIYWLQQEGKMRWSWIQIACGLYLLFFIVVHAAAALMARAWGRIDTNFYWPAGTLTVWPLPLFFAPYYFLAVVALGGHLGAALHFRERDRAGRLVFAAAPLLAVAILIPFAGVLYPVDLPPEHESYYDAYRGAIGQQ